MPSTLRSSSTSGQWTPCPSLIISYLFRCSGVASLSRHDHANGTLITRPSIRWKVIRSLVTDTCLTRASVLTAMLTPCLLNLSKLFLNDRTNLVQFPSRESVVLRQCYRLQP